MNHLWIALKALGITVSLFLFVALLIVLGPNYGPPFFVFCLVFAFSYFSLWAKQEEAKKYGRNP